jgi:hypothetical protein
MNKRLLIGVQNQTLDLTGGSQKCNHIGLMENLLGGEGPTDKQSDPITISRRGCV